METMNPRLKELTERGEHFSQYGINLLQAFNPHQSPQPLLPVWSV
jgi:hypothetical protein